MASCRYDVMVKTTYKKNNCGDGLVLNSHNITASL